MKSLLEQSAILWIISRLVLIVVYVVWLCTLNLHEELMHPFTFPRVTIGALYTILNCIVLYYELKNNKTPFLTRSFIGGISALFALNLIVTALLELGLDTINNMRLMLYIITALYFILFALYDIYIIERD